MHALRQYCFLGCCVAVFSLPMGCGSKQVDYDAVTLEQLSPEDQQRIRHMREEANRAAATGQPLPPDVITEDMILRGEVVDGVYVGPQQ